MKCPSQNLSRKRRKRGQMTTSLHSRALSSAPVYFPMDGLCHYLSDFVMQKKYNNNIIDWDALSIHGALFVF
ncbi:MAG: hypothetical protein K2J48_09345 [Muribaculaceae bacterium]|nr:hypothetical protein [Muribaculaceae bacterium]